MTTVQRHDTIVVGAGLAGLCATVHLAKAGHEVLLLEQHSDVGGRARTDNLDGWLFNHGAHALYRNGLGHGALRALGIEPRGELAPLDGAQVAIDGRTTVLPIDVNGIARTKALSARGKVGFAKLMAGLAKLDPVDYSDVSVDEWLAQYRPDVAALTKAVVRLATYAAATDLLSADVAIGQLQRSGDGVLYLHGGWAQLCSQLVDEAIIAGAEIRKGIQVGAIEETATGNAVAVDGRTHEATTVIVAAGGPELTARLLGLESAVFGETGPPPQAAVLDLALDAMPANHRFILGVDEPTYFSVHSPPARLAPDGKVAAVAMRYLASDDDGTPDEHRESLERIAALAGIGTPVRSRFLRRMTVTNGLPVASAGGLAGRPGTTIAGRPGVFVAGDWVGDKALLADSSIVSGVAAATAAGLVVTASRSRGSQSGGSRQTASHRLASQG